MFKKLGRIKTGLGERVLLAGGLIAGLAGLTGCESPAERAAFDFALGMAGVNSNLTDAQRAGIAAAQQSVRLYGNQQTQLDAAREGKSEVNVYVVGHDKSEEGMLKTEVYNLDTGVLDCSIFGGPNIAYPEQAAREHISKRAKERVIPEKGWGVNFYKDGTFYGRIVWLIVEEERSEGITLKCDYIKMGRE